MVSDGLGDTGVRPTERMQGAEWKVRVRVKGLATLQVALWQRGLEYFRVPLKGKDLPEFRVQIRKRWNTHMLALREVNMSMSHTQVWHQNEGAGTPSPPFRGLPGASRDGSI